MTSGVVEQRWQGWQEWSGVGYPEGEGAGGSLEGAEGSHEGELRSRGRDLGLVVGVGVWWGDSGATHFHFRTLRRFPTRSLQVSESSSSSFLSERGKQRRRRLMRVCSQRGQRSRCGTQ